MVCGECIAHPVRKSAVMKRILFLCVALSIATAVIVGCDKKSTTTERKTTVSTPEGSTTTTDTHKVQSSGEAPPADAPR
jgi:hypothetical protein